MVLYGQTRAISSLGSFLRLAVIMQGGQGARSWVTKRGGSRWALRPAKRNELGQEQGHAFKRIRDILIYSFFLADPGKARGCSTNTSVIH